MVTIADVAQAAGVSISTVSYVMSGKRTISQDTRVRVEAAIAKLGFSPHAGARSLASRATNVIGLQAPLRAGVDVHVVMQIATGVVTQAREHGYDILLLTSDDAAGLERAARASMVDALLLMDVESDDARIATLEGLKTPSVLIGLPAGADRLTCVDFDFEAAGALAATRLADAGHRRVALIGSPAEVIARHTSYADRLARGFLSTCEARGVVGSVHASPASADAVGVVDELLAAEPDLSGVLVHNEGALPHVAARLAAAGAQHVELIALCPADVARSVPALDEVIELPAEEMGAVATRVVHEMLAGGQPDRVHLIAPRIVEGG